jgi:hypothetical protein
MAVEGVESILTVDDGNVVWRIFTSHICAITERTNKLTVQLMNGTIVTLTNQVDIDKFNNNFLLYTKSSRHILLI